LLPDDLMKIGFVGTGRMGLAMARRLINAGHELRVWNRTREKAQSLESLGAIVVDTPLEAAREAEVVLSMLADDRAVMTAILDGTAPVIDGLGAGRIHVSMSTISPTLSKRLLEAHKAKNQSYIAAPVLGRPEAAARGELIVVAAGVPAAIAQAKPIFEAIAKESKVIDDVAPRANVVKLAVNFVLASLLEVLGEAYSLVEGYGIDDKRFLDIVNTMLKSPVVAAYGEKIATRAFEPAGFSMRLGTKDILLTLDAGQAHSVPMPVANLLRDRFLEGLGRGMQDSDWSAMARIAPRK
jgi:3-hydroxyisobutyrate dehydrogenase-like beta-hydroxyacid dehydrogenase